MSVMRSSGSSKVYVQIDRDDGSRTYKGPWIHAHAMREMSAWKHAFHGYQCRLLSAEDPETRADVRRFDRAAARSVRYFPERKGERDA